MTKKKTETSQDNITLLEKLFNYVDETMALTMTLIKRGGEPYVTIHTDDQTKDWQSLPPTIIKKGSIKEIEEKIMSSEFSYNSIMTLAKEKEKKDESPFKETPTSIPPEKKGGPVPKKETDKPGDESQGNQKVEELKNEPVPSNNTGTPFSTPIEQSETGKPPAEDNTVQTNLNSNVQKDEEW